jgi:hypothetical protein
MAQVEIVKTFDGKEMKVIKRNRVNYVLEDDKGVRWNYKAIGLTFVRWEEEKTPEIDPLIRIGATVKVKSDAALRRSPKFAALQHKSFVIIGFGKAPGDFNIIEAGGNARNSYWGAPAKDLELA